MVYALALIILIVIILVLLVVFGIVVPTLFSDEA